MKIFIKIFYVFIILLFLYGCKKETNTQSEQKIEEKKIKIGLALSASGIGDGSFNDMQYKGLNQCAKDYGVDIAIRVPPTDEIPDLKKALELLITEDKCDFIIAGEGFLMVDPVDELAKKYTDKKFVVMDTFAKPDPNVASIIFAQNEGSFVVGALMALMTKTNKIGFIGGVDIPVVKAFEIGFLEGVKYINKKVKTEVKYVSLLPDFSGFSDPDKGYKIANDMYNKGVDIIYSVAGLTGNGIIKCAKERKQFVVGVDSDQDFMAEGYVLTSMMKRLDNAVYDIVGKFMNNEFEGNKIFEYSYINGGISLTEMKYTKHLYPQSVLDKITEIEKKIMSGEIKVTNYLKK